MADDNKDASEETTEEAPAKGGIKKIILMVVAALLIAGISVVATIFLMPTPEPVSSEESITNTNDATSTEGEELSMTQAIYLPMRPPFIVNYQSGSRQRFLQLELSLMARDQESIDVAKKHQPLLRNNFIAILSSQTYENLRTDEGKMALIDELTVAVQAVLLEQIGRPGIEKVLLTSFVLQ